MKIFMEDNDHRKIGAELDLFTFSDLVGPGLPLWTPKGTLFRDELDKLIWKIRRAKGYELGGLTRVLSITQDDAHVFCRTTQVREEFLKIWDIVDEFYKKFGFTLRVRLSFRDPKTPEKYIGTPATWDKAEAELRSIAEER